MQIVLQLLLWSYYTGKVHLEFPDINKRSEPRTNQNCKDNTEYIHTA